MKSEDSREKMLDNMAKTLFGSEGFKEGSCSRCSKSVNGPTDFNDEISWSEYKISHLCQDCQDFIFAPEGCRECTGADIEPEDCDACV